ncbi:MAG TPA: hypothetical protein VIH59_16365 [Candidatus Tectomicrobia bacterium]
MARQHLPAAGPLVCRTGGRDATAARRRPPVGPEGERPNAYIIRQIQEDRFFIGCETEEITMSFALKIVGNKPFIYSSDFPHEVTNQSCKHDIGAAGERGADSGGQGGVLYRNAQRFYKL